MADFTIRELVYDVRDHYTPDIVPRDTRFNDKRLVTAEVGSYKPNAWGLYDMHGNVCEWTRSEYKPYPYSEQDGYSDTSYGTEKVARGGSWYDRPKRCRSASRLSYPQWQKVYNVGFRIVLEADNQTQQFVSNN
jgi:formylglycine-generating enzyme required for sulfatase activity